VLENGETYEESSLEFEEVNIMKMSLHDLEVIEQSHDQVLNTDENGEINKERISLEALNG
jgi:hypothetical protein